MKEKQLLKTIVEGIQEKKGKKITTVDLSKIESAATSHFIICEGQSTTQVMAIADSIREYVLQNTGIKPFGYDGYQNGQWIVIDTHWKASSPSWRCNTAASSARTPTSRSLSGSHCRRCFRYPPQSMRRCTPHEQRQSRC